MYITKDLNIFFGNCFANNLSCFYHTCSFYIYSLCKNMPSWHVCRYNFLAMEVNIAEIVPLSLPLLYNLMFAFLPQPISL